MKKILIFLGTLFLFGISFIPLSEAISEDNNSISSKFFQADSMLPTNWDTPHFDPNKAPDSGQGVDLPKSKKQDGLDQIQDLIINNFGQIMKYLLISVALLYLFLTVLMMLMAEEESRIEDLRGRVGTIVLGLLLVGLAPELVKVFDISSSAGEVGDKAHLELILRKIINWIALISGAVAIFFMLISAMRMIMAQGDETVIEDEKKDFKYGFVGLITIISADVIINKVFYPENTELSAPGIEQTKTFAQEVFAFLKYLLEYMAVIAILFMIMSSIYYVVSFGDDEQTETAKRILKNLIMGFIMIVFAYVVVSGVSPDTAGNVIAQ